MVKKLDFKKIDAFTDGSSYGNPAGCVTLSENEQLTGEEMLQIASELKGFVSEVGFVQQAGDEFNLKYYSSEREVEFCGHATIAIMYDLIKNDENLLKKDEVFINVNAGKLTVFNHIKNENAVYIMAPEPKYIECNIEKEAVSQAFCVNRSIINNYKPIEIVDGGLRTLIVPIKSHDDCVAISPDLDALNLFCKDNDIDIIHVWTSETNNKNAQYRTRVFAPTFGYLEDPATGSGNAAFGYYLVKNNLWKSDVLIEQSSNLANPNYINLKKHNSDSGMRMLFGGCATNKIIGMYYLNSK